MRVLWHSNGPWVGTGYGSQTDLMLSALQRLGHEPVCFAYYGLQGGMIEHNGYKVIPGTDFDGWGNDVVGAHTREFKADAIVSLVDLFVLDPGIWGKLQVPWIAWVPIDHEEIGHPTLERLKQVTVPVAMSDFGAHQMIAAGLDTVHRIYHAVDTDVFRPLDKAECRAEFGVDPDAYIVGMVMANKGDRKQYPQQLAAVKRWMDENPDRDVRVFLHTDPTDKMGGWDMKSLVAKLGLKGKVYSTSQYFTSVIPLPQDQMAKIYNCFDVLMNATAGEGFGIPIIEAQSCGVPVVAGNYTAMSELVHYGYAVKPAARVLGAHFGFQYVPDPEDMVYRLECIYRMADKTHSELGRQWVIDNCSVPVVAAQWHELLQLVDNTTKITEAPSVDTPAAPVPG